MQILLSEPYSINNWWHLSVLLSIFKSANDNWLQKIEMFQKSKYCPIWNVKNQISFTPKNAVNEWRNSNAKCHMCVGLCNRFDNISQVCTDCNTFHIRSVFIKYCLNSSCSRQNGSACDIPVHIEICVPQQAMSASSWHFEKDELQIAFTDIVKCNQYITATSLYTAGYSSQ